MMKRVRITNEQESLFAPCWELYTTAFPEIERRNKEYHLMTLQFEEFHFEAILDEDIFIGIIGWWEFDNTRFIEHLATKPTLRDQGYGRKILEGFIGESNKQIILEVEHPHEELSKRRIGFYERIGFKLSDYEYSHPSYDTTSSERVTLLLMSYPALLSTESCEKFEGECFERVHFGNRLCL